MADQFDEPQNVPTVQSNPIRETIDFRAGKTAQNYVSVATVEIAEAGFSCWDKEKKEAVKMKSLTLYVLARAARVAGKVFGSDKKPIASYLSNYIFDTRTDNVRLYHFESSRAVCEGSFSDVKKFINENGLKGSVGHENVLICYCAQTDSIVALPLRKALECGIKNAIGARTQTSPDKINIYELNSLTTQIWALSFTGEFLKVAEDMKPYKNEGDMYFMPSFYAGVITNNGKKPELFAQLVAMQAEVNRYIESWIKPAEQSLQQEAPAHQATPPPQNTHTSNTRESAPFPQEAPPQRTFDDLPF